MSTELARAHIEAQSRLQARTGEAVAAAWRSLPSYNRADIPAWLGRVSPLLYAAQSMAVGLVDAFIAQSVGRQPLGLDPAPIIADARNGTPVEEVYERPFVTVWTDLANEVQWMDAVLDGLEQAVVAAETDVQLAMREAVAEITEVDEDIVGYRRVANPDACTLCLIASTQRYHVGELLPIHSRCRCGIEVITGTEDPGLVIDRDLLRQLKEDGRAGDLSLQQAASRARRRAVANRERMSELLADASAETDPDRSDRLQDRAVPYARRARRQEEMASQYAEMLRQRRAQRAGPGVAVRMHGELGPVLTNASHRFTTVDDLIVA